MKKPSCRRCQPSPASTPALAARLHIDQGWLQEVIDILQQRQQIVLYGPPGTGKTFLAEEIARHVAERDAVRLVQFHPSYAYEDFFEGFRPVSAHDLRLLPHVKPGDGPTDDHALDLRRALENGEVRGGAGSFRR